MTLALLASLVVAQTSSAPSVVLLVPRLDAPTMLAARLRAELEALGFQVEVDRLDDTGSVRDVLDATERPNLTAVLALAMTGPEARAIDVWVSDRATGKTVLRRLKVDGARGEASALALKAVELLRASLVELSFDTAREVPSAVKVLSTTPPPPPSRFSLGVGAGLSLVRSAAPGAHVGLAASVRLPLVFTGEVLGRVTLVPATGTVSGGLVQVQEQSLLAGPGLRVELMATLEAGVVVLAGLSRVEAQGIAVDSALVGSRRAVVSASVEPGVFLRWWFSPHWGASLRAAARLDSAPAVAQVGGVDAVIAGLPSVSVSALLEVRP